MLFSTTPLAVYYINLTFPPRSCHEIQTRIDRIISTIRTAHHEPVMSSPVGPASGDVVIVAHGDILRAFAARWVGREIDTNPHMLLEAGGVGTLRYVCNFTFFQKNADGMGIVMSMGRLMSLGYYWVGLLSQRRFSHFICLDYYMRM